MMEELRQILLAHRVRYPLMEPQDAVKLIYQNEFGCGHMITNADACLCYLRQEYPEAKKHPTPVEWEPIGNGLGRIYLAAVKEQELEALGQAFLRSGEAHQGTKARFLEKLELLKLMADQSAFPFGPVALDAYLERYTGDGYPAVSHSRAYRNAYHPAYRVVLQSLWHP